jgi:MoxR-like ATPase
MAKKSKSVSPAGGGKAEFVGRYVGDLRDALVASATSGRHALFISPPGWGKSDIPQAVAEKIWGPGGYTQKTFSPATMPDEVRGLMDVAAALDPVNQRFERVLTGTVYDPNAGCHIIDELFRSSDPVFDMLLDTFERKDVDPADAPVNWATSNFVVKSDRVAALRDRITFWVHVQPETIDVRAVVGNWLRRVPGDRLVVPGLDRLALDPAALAVIRHTQPDPGTMEVVLDFLELLANEAAESEFFLHPRRANQWGDVVYRVGMFYSGSAQFGSIPQQAGSVLRWCWPTVDLQEWSKWGAVVDSIADTVGAALRAYEEQAFERFRKIQEDGRGDVGRTSVELGTALGQIQSELKKLAPNDPRADEMVRKLTRMFQVILSGKNPFEDEDEDEEEDEVPF